MLPPAADHALLAPLLRAQHGAVSRVQALTCGLTDSGIAARLLSGRWQRAHQGVYLAFSGPVPRQARVWAALLRAGPGAVASHRTAAELEGLTGGPAYGPGASSELIHVTVPANRRIKPIDGVQIHYTRQLAVKRHPSLLPPRTRTEHTVLDLIDEAVTIDEVLTWVTRACQRRHTTPALLRSALALRSNVRWAAELAAVLSDVEDGAESGTGSGVPASSRAGARPASCSPATSASVRAGSVRRRGVRGLSGPRRAGRPGRACRGGCVPGHGQGQRHDHRRVGRAAVRVGARVRRAMFGGWSGGQGADREWLGGAPPEHADGTAGSPSRCCSRRSRNKPPL
jgi:hypothetical protein